MIDKLYEAPEFLNLADNEDEAYEWFTTNNINPKLDKVYKLIFKNLFDFYKFIYISFLQGKEKENYKLVIFEPAMCCPTGLCGFDVDPELLRITTVLNTIEKNGIKVERYNLSSAPQEFIKNIVVTDYIRDKGVEALPVSVLNGEIVIQGRYPMNEELVQLLDIPLNYVESQEVGEISNSEVEEECCGGSCCCSDSCC